MAIPLVGDEVSYFHTGTAKLNQETFPHNNLLLIGFGVLLTSSCLMFPNSNNTVRPSVKSMRQSVVYTRLKLSLTNIK